MAERYTMVSRWVDFSPSGSCVSVVLVALTSRPARPLLHDAPATMVADGTCSSPSGKVREASSG